MGAYETAGKSDEWFTPKYIFDALGLEFDLDVASPVEGPRYVPARRWISENGLSYEWSGLVWMNPPFGHMATKRLWLQKFFEHGNGVALLPDRTSAPWWQEFAPLASRVLFISPKVKFERPDGSVGNSPGTGTTLFAAGPQAARALDHAVDLGCCFVPAGGKAVNARPLPHLPSLPTSCDFALTCHPISACDRR